ncbi:SAM-dependent DNA methyltransferase [Helicobacter jaachi]|uniref:site-specific DNA-methyltransferase (adenine-specific) n=1 Tax=Helicobacter jaachi TaxID=1677920 RepID=A0A4U8TBQ5_9HELI|nr:class I SAM-dependent DNA methyltransferase [Helicobacter jaachi]TLD97370.1 SAM-dependent DNA methyltransferase [Helicobacter jaachi]
MTLNIKSLQNIMRNDAGVNGDAQRIEQIVWILFLKIYDLYEKNWKSEAKLKNTSYTSIIPPNLAWDKWAKDTKDLTSDELLNFVNNDLFPALKNLQITPDTPLNKKIVKYAFEDANNYMKDGILLRKIINEIDELEIKQMKDRQELSRIYETFIKDLQNNKHSGEFYTPRAVTDFVIEYLNPNINDKIADLACGTGGFLTSAYHFLESKINTANDRDIANSYFTGIEKKQLPYILAVTGFLINGIENPNLKHDNTLETHYNDLYTLESFDIIAMNPPFGGNEKEQIQANFPTEFKSSETADLFMAVILERLKVNGKAAVVLPDGFLFGQDSAKINLKKRLLNEFDLHLILRLPPSVFAPYTGITTNILFFNKTPSGTQKTWFYRLDMPPNIKSFGKTKSMKLEHFDPFRQWDKNRVELSDDNNNFKAKSFSKDELIAREYNFDLCGFVSEQEEILDPFSLIKQIKEQRDNLNTTLDSIMSQISAIIKENQ